ncbi:MAG TPA: hypothetical protein VF747_01760 [Blastocatellia bacterium]|jgi:hypothetical protein
MQRKSFLSIQRFFVIAFCALLVLTAASFVEAQSGRRIPKKPSSPDPLPPAQSEPPVQSPEPKDTKPQTSILVVKYLPHINTSNIYSDAVMSGCLKRLQESPMVKVRPGKDMNRKEASDYAKASEDTYVVWIQLEVDIADTDRASIGGVNPFSLYVDYVVFTPGTGKSKASGHVYQRNRRVGSPLPRTTGVAEYSLRYAGEETADRVLDALGFSLPSRRF